VGRPSDTFKQYIGRNSNHLFEREQDEVPVAYAENCLILSLIQQALDRETSRRGGEFSQPTGFPASHTSGVQPPDWGIAEWQGNRGSAPVKMI
jgi:hypothetical protein